MRKPTDDTRASFSGVTVQAGREAADGPFFLITGDAPDQLQELRWLIKDCGYIALEEADVKGSEGSAQVRADVVLVNFATVATASPQRVMALREEYGKPVVCVLPYPNATEFARIDQLAADELVFKPLRFEELASRLKLVLGRNRPEITYPIMDRRRRGRRKEDREAVPNPARASNSPLQVREREKVVLYRGRELQLSRKEYLLLSLLASEPGRVFSQQEIIARLWPTSRRAAATDVQQYVCLLRKKVELDPSNPRLIKTVSSFGYKLDPPEEM